MPHLDTSSASSDEQYSDGDSEITLLELFKGCTNPQSAAEDLLARDPSWPIRYHLSPLRTNLLSWYPFKPEGSLLEIGAGCGALTELFCQRVADVTAVELTKRRAEIIYHRCRNCDNLKIITGNFANVSINETFDYISSIGVLEYAERYGKSTSAHLDFLQLAKRYLKPHGTIILAIENKFGLKYWAGAREDHTGRFFDSIENYPSNPGVRTFSKLELSDLLEAAGFCNIKFYYPLPDYKLPLELFSESYLPSSFHGIRPGILPAIDYAMRREVFFDEKLAMDNIIQSHAFEFFANSFLVFATRNISK